MTSHPTDIIAAADADATQPDTAPTAAGTPVAGHGRPTSRTVSVQPVLEKLFTLYPALFGAEFLPLKRGVFQDLLAAHPEAFDRASLKAALGLHTRGTRYLQCVAAGKQRHDLQGHPVEPVAPEHVFQAILELFRRRQARTQADLRPRVRAQLAAAFDASGLDRLDYLSRIQCTDASAQAMLDDVFAERDQQRARQDAMRKAFEASAKTPAEFAAMYGLDPRDVAAMVGIAPTQA